MGSVPITRGSGRRDGFVARRVLGDCGRCAYTRKRVSEHEHTSPTDALTFEHLVQQAIDELPSDIRAEMSNVDVTIEDEPPPGQRLLGLYRGIPLTRRGSNYAGVLPDKITIYRGPLERMYGSDPNELRRQVRRTVRHEIAHHFGISDERLVEIDRY